MNFGEGDMAQPITPITQLEETVDQMTQQCANSTHKNTPGSKLTKLASSGSFVISYLG